jgi:hypothetical protein
VDDVAGNEFKAVIPRIAPPTGQVAMLLATPRSTSGKGIFTIQNHSCYRFPLNIFAYKNI